MILQRIHRSAFYSFLFIVFFQNFAKASQEHPHLLATDEVKALTLRKLDSAPWARSLFSNLVQNLKPYVDRHQKDPAWIISRLGMNWKKPYSLDHSRGKVLVNGEKYDAITSRSGEGEFPTIRPVETRFKVLSSKGYGLSLPTLEKLRPFSATGKHPTKSDDKADTASYEAEVDINYKIYGLARDAAFLYWLGQGDAYGRFAADILSTFAMCYYQQTFDGESSGSTGGKVTWQTINDAILVESMGLTYDFVYDYLKQHQGESTTIEICLNGEGPVVDVVSYPVADFEKLQKCFDSACELFINRGNLNNWVLKENPGFVAAALCLDDRDRRDFMMARYADIVSPKHLPMAVMISNYDQVGYWNETPGYHMAVGVDALMAEKNGYAILSRFPLLYRSASAIAEVAFQNGKSPNIGDGGSGSVHSRNLDVLAGFAEAMKSPEAARLQTLLKQNLSIGAYDRTKTENDLPYLNSKDFICLIYGKDTFTNGSAVKEISDLPMTLSLRPFSDGENRFNSILQKAGAQVSSGIAYNIAGGRVGHGHLHGPDFEFFALGHSLICVPGRTASQYGAAIGNQYLNKAAGHNVVVINGASRDQSPLTLEASEPIEGQPAISPFCAFSSVSFKDNTPGNEADELRTSGFIKTTGTQGFAFDIVRVKAKSSEAITHDLLFHAKADNVVFKDFSDKSLETDEAQTWKRLTSIKDTDEKGSGYSYFSEIVRVKSSEPVLSLFSLKDRSSGQDLELRLWLNNNAEREILKASSPRAVTADKPYNELNMPTMILRQHGEAWSKPFVSILEPALKGAARIKAVRYFYDSASDLVFTEVDQLDGAGGELETIFLFHSTRSNSLQKNIGTHEGLNFQGQFGAICVSLSKVKWLYLGKGSLLEYQGQRIEASENEKWCAFQRVNR